MMMFPKIKRCDSKKYLRWVRSLPSCISGQPAECAHHIIGVGNGTKGSKAGDIFTIPLTYEEHAELHHDVKAWHAKHGSQYKFVVKTQELAYSEGVLRV